MLFFLYLIFFIIHITFAENKTSVLLLCTAVKECRVVDKNLRNVQNGSHFHLVTRIMHVLAWIM